MSGDFALESESMSTLPLTKKSKGNYIQGQFTEGSSSARTWALASPADQGDVPFEARFVVDHVEDAVSGAKTAWRTYRKTSWDERKALLARYRDALAARRDALTLAIARSVGKPLWEAKTEVSAMIAKVDITLGPGRALIDLPVPTPEGTHLRTRSIGVCLVLGPFNFPGHLANGHFVPALLMGNTVVFKPSEKACEVGELIAECMHEAGAPPGVFQLVQGDGEIAEALVAHPDIDAVMFTGSTNVGKRILAASALYPGRLIALELGGRNPAIVCADADVKYAAAEIAFSAFVTAGQRCTANSRILVDPAVADAFLAEFTALARGIRVGHPLADDVFLGPVIDEVSEARALGLVLREREHFEALVPLESRRNKGSLGEGSYLSPGVYLRRTRAYSPLAEAELFAPVATVEVAPFADVAELANSGPYGLAAAVFTRSQTTFRELADELEVGLCNWNRASVGSSSSLPFGGRKSSGNHRPAGLFSSLYCVDYIAELHVAEPPQVASMFPGFPSRA
jgi:succinylglutamic semialdehyde dehydrogenase